MKKRNLYVGALAAGVMTGYVYNHLSDERKAEIKKHLRKHKGKYIAGGVGVAVGVVATVLITRKPTAEPVKLANGLREMDDDMMVLVTNPKVNFYAFGKDADVRLLMTDTQADAYNAGTELFEKMPKVQIPGTNTYLPAANMDMKSPEVTVFNRVAKLINTGIKHEGPLPMGTDYDRLVQV